MNIVDQRFWHQNGYVVIRNIVPIDLINSAVAAIWDFLEMDARASDSWYPYPPRPNIMVEMYHHPALWAIRQLPAIYDVFAEILGTKSLWVTLDRCSMNPPEVKGTWEFARNYHWDTELRTPFPLSVGGMVYLTDTSREQGAFQCLPGFHKNIDAWIENLPTDANPREMLTDAFQSVPGRAGDLVIWHYALPHYAGRNRAASPRLTQYISMFPAQEDASLRERRILAYKEKLAGIDNQFIHEPLRVSEKKSLSTEASLSPLGEKLLGLQEW